MKFRPTLCFISVPKSPKVRRVKARRCDSCLMASDTFIGSQETVTSSSRKLTTSVAGAVFLQTVTTSIVCHFNMQFSTDCVHF